MGSASATPLVCNSFYSPSLPTTTNYGSGPKITFKNVRRVFYYIGTASTLYYSVQMYPFLKYVVQSPYVTEAQIQQIQEKTFDPNSVRQAQFQNWQDAFKAENGRWPDPQAHPEDAEEYYRVYNSIRKIPNEKLKI